MSREILKNKYFNFFYKQVVIIKKNVYFCRQFEC